MPPVQGVAVDERAVGEALAAALLARTVSSATDSRHVEPFTEQVSRVSPIRAKSEHLARLHGTNERVSLADPAELVRFYHRLLQQSAGH